MKKQILITLAVVGLTISACSKKDSYRPVTGGNGSGGPSQVSQSTEEKAIEMLTTDQRYASILDSESSESLKSNVDGVEFQPIQSETENTTINKVQFTFLDKNSKDCTPKQIDVMAYSEQELISGAKIKGVGELKCVEKSDCSSVMLTLEKKGEAFVDGNLRQNITTGAAPILFMRDEEGVFKPVKTESDIFADAKSIDDSIQACLERKAKITNTYKEYADSRIAGQNQSSATSQDAEALKLQKMTKEIQSLEAQLKNNAPSNSNELKAKIAALKSQRSELIRQRQTRLYKESVGAQQQEDNLETMDPTAGLNTTQKKAYQAPRVGPQ
ncbi:hypothetical protein K2X05_11200 [bacterium]|nr:hypothetical protein [bacterium]